MTEAVRYVQTRHNPRLRLLGYLISRFKRARGYQRGYQRQLRTHFGELAFDTMVPDLSQFEKSVTDRIPVTAQAPSSPAAAIARQFFDEVVRRTNQSGRGGLAGSRADVQQEALAGA